MQGDTTPMAWYNSNGNIKIFHWLRHIIDDTKHIAEADTAIGHCNRDTSLYCPLGEFCGTNMRLFNPTYIRVLVCHKMK